VLKPKDPPSLVICVECTRAWQCGEDMQLLAVDVDQLKPKGRQQVRQTQAAIRALRASGRIPPRQTRS